MIKQVTTKMTGAAAPQMVAAGGCKSIQLGGPDPVAPTPLAPGSAAHQLLLVLVDPIKELLVADLLVLVGVGQGEGLLDLPGLPAEADEDLGELLLIDEAIAVLVKALKGGQDLSFHQCLDLPLRHLERRLLRLHHLG